MSAIRAGLNQKWELAVIFILIAAFLDGMDGRLARLLKATSNFGAQLDSLSDFLSFGVAPAIVIYLWILQHMSSKGLGWAIALFYSVCMVIRLARFNTSLDEEERPSWADQFFVGVPAPAGAALALIPMMLSFEYNIAWISANVVGGYILLVAILLASRIPTFSAKKIVIRREYASLVLVFAGLIITAMLIEPWGTLTFLACLYLSTIPISVVIHYKLKVPK